MDDMAADCSTDGTCEGESGEPGAASRPVEGVKWSNLTLWEETALAAQQFSIGARIKGLKK